jgi:Gas vesicle protein K
MTAQPSTKERLDEALISRPTSAGIRVALRPNEVKNGLGKLVLTLIELIRQLLEKQAIRRMDAGSLADDEIERLGITFLQLGDQMKQLREQFGLEDEELNLDLGPLGKLL